MGVAMQLFGATICTFGLCAMIFGGVMIVVGATLLIGLRGGTTRLPGCGFSALLLLDMPECIRADDDECNDAVAPWLAALGRMAGLLCMADAEDANVVADVTDEDDDDATPAVELVKTASDDDLWTPARCGCCCSCCFVGGFGTFDGARFARVAVAELSESALPLLVLTGTFSVSLSLDDDAEAGDAAADDCRLCCWNVVPMLIGCWWAGGECCWKWDCCWGS